MMGEAWLGWEQWGKDHMVGSGLDGLLDVVRFV